MILLKSLIFIAWRSDLSVFKCFQIDLFDSNLQAIKMINAEEGLHCRKEDPTQREICLMISPKLAWLAVMSVNEVALLNLLGMGVSN